MALPDPHLHKLEPEKLPEALREAWQRSMDLRGDGTFFQVLGNAPELFDWYSEFYQRIFYGGRVPVRFKELARIRLSTVHGCRFCNQGNRLDALAAGLSEQQLESLDNYGDGPFSDAEKAVLAVAEEMLLTNQKGHLTSAQYQALRAHFDDGQIFELGMTMAVLAGMAKFLFVFDLVEKEDYCPL